MKMRHSRMSVQRIRCMGHSTIWNMLDRRYSKKRPSEPVCGSSTRTHIGTLAKIGCEQCWGSAGMAGV